MLLNTKDILFQRNDKGELIAQEIELELLDDKPTIKAVPITRGKLMELYSKYGSNTSDWIKMQNDIIKFGLIEPKLNDQEIEDLKSNIATAISVGILSISLGMPQDAVNKQSEKVISEMEAELKKK